MKYALLIAAVLTIVVTPAILVPASDSAPRNGYLFIVQFSTGPAWKEGVPFSQQTHAQEHSANLQRLRAEGTLLFGGRYADKGLIIIRSISDATAREEIEQDPAVTSGVFTYELALLDPFYEGCITREVSETAAP